VPNVPDIALAEELRRRRIHPNPRLGQNFMVDRQMLDFLVHVADVTKSDTVLEIGTGAGFLTQRLCEAAGRVVSVEIDLRLYELSCERLATFGNLTLVRGDALAGEHSYADYVVKALQPPPPPRRDAAIAAERPRKRTALRAANMRQTCGTPSGPCVMPHGGATAHGSAIKVVSNLPYSIASAVVQATLESDLPFSGVWATVQKEVGERLSAAPGEREYSFVSAFVSILADIRIVRRLPASVFWPQPRVESAIVEVLLRPEKRRAAGDIEAVRRVLSKLFSFRRKELRSALKLSGLDPKAIARVEERANEIGVSGRERVFRLRPETLVEIARAADVTP